jgi:hypothetical protein
VPVCDGCGMAVDEAHIRARIERLELATRFRPIHINVLLIDAVPLDALHDFFYAVSSEPPQAPRDAFFRELAKLAMIQTRPAQRTEDSPLESVPGEFQRRGFFLTSAVECPMQNQDDLRAAIRRLTPTVLRRVQNSYKPKYIALISQPTTELIAPLRETRWGDRLVLDEGGGPFMCPTEEGQPAEARNSLGNRLLTALSRFP